LVSTFAKAMTNPLSLVLWLRKALYVISHLHSVLQHGSIHGAPLGGHPLWAAEKILNQEESFPQTLHYPTLSFMISKSLAILIHASK
jgi:hypothetical protein